MCPFPDLTINQKKKLQEHTFLFSFGCPKYQNFFYPFLGFDVKLLICVGGKKGSIKVNALYPQCFWGQKQKIGYFPPNLVFLVTPQSQFSISTPLYFQGKIRNPFYILPISNAIPSRLFWSFLVEFRERLKKNSCHPIVYQQPNLFNPLVIQHLLNPLVTFVTCCTASLAVALSVISSPLYVTCVKLCQK